jgi:hypothetical protein
MEESMQLRYLVFNPVTQMFERNEDAGVYSSEAFVFKLSAAVERLVHVGKI